MESTCDKIKIQCKDREKKINENWLITEKDYFFMKIGVTCQRIKSKKKKELTQGKTRKQK